MRRTSAVALLALVGVLAAPVFAQEAAKWEIDRAHSAAHFAVRHYAVTTVRGTFTNITGTILIDDKNLANSSVDVTIDANTVNTQNENRDKHLRSADFFEVEKYPTITFKSKKVEPAGPGRAKVTGDLTIRGVTKEVVLDVEGPTPPFNTGRAIKRGATASTKINRRDFGVSWGGITDNVAVVGDEITITIDLELNAPRAAAASGQ